MTGTYAVSHEEMTYHLLQILLLELGAYNECSIDVLPKLALIIRALRRFRCFLGIRVDNGQWEMIILELVLVLHLIS